MTQDRRSLRALSALLPSGILGLSISLASADSMAATSTGERTAPKDPGSVALRLQAIRNSDFSRREADQRRHRERRRRAGNAARLVGQRLASRLGLAQWWLGQRRLAQWRLGQRRLAQRRLGQRWLA